MKGKRAALTAIASHLPEERRTNEMLAEEFSDWTAEKLTEKTGIEARRISEPDQFTSDLAILAAERLFAQDPGHRDGIDFVLLVTVTPDYLSPGTSVLVQDKLGLPQSVGALDVLWGCAGYPYALTLGAGLIESGRARKVLILTADRLHTFVDEGEVGVKALMGDAATASLLESVEEGEDASRAIALLGACSYGTDGSGAQQLWLPTSGLRGFTGDEVREVSKPTMEMDGAAVFHFTLRVIPKYIRESLDEAGLTMEDVDLFVFHQANRFMLDHLRRRLKIPEERFVYYLAESGNTACNTVPLALDHAIREGRVKPGGRVFLVAFGTGWSWSSMLLEAPGSI